MGPLLEAAAPLTEKSSQRDLRRAGRTLTDAAGAVPGLADDARDGVGAAIFIAQTLHSAEIGTSLAELRSFLPAASRLLAELDRDERGSLARCDAQLRTRALTTAGQVGCLLQIVPNIRNLLKSQRAINRASLSTQRRTLARTGRTNQLFAESLAIQREILERTRSIDRKLPPPVAPPGP